MGDTVIRVEDVSKEYQLGRVSTSFKETLVAALKGRKVHKEYFKALDQVNFEVQEGDVLGIVGKNGAGKSTLLKILSRITYPSEGQAVIQGRLASLLEVGTGFHLELTGKENVYLNGAIMGMSRQEVRRKYDEIVAFSGVEKFLETPVKHYSSGMYVRLAFAVAAHLEPDILVIDEVLAVGDSSFQAKCIKKMTEVASEGRTVLFVSHNMQALKNLCTRAILLRQGKKIMDGTVHDVIDSYMSSVRGRGGTSFNTEGRKGRARCQFSFIEIKENLLTTSGTFTLNLKLDIREANLRDLKLNVQINDSFGTVMVEMSNTYYGQHIDEVQPDKTYSFLLDPLRLKKGIYFLTVFAFANEELQDHLKDTLILQVEAGNVYQQNFSEAIQGAFQPDFEFKVH